MRKPRFNHSFALAALFVFHSSIFCRAEVSDLLINEIQTSNVDMYLSPVWNYDAWMEFYNPTDTAVSLFHCYFSDDPLVPKKYPVTWQFDVPAHGFAVMWLGEHEDTAPHQIPLDADCDGGWYGIYDRYANLLLSISYPKGVSRASWARNTDGGDDWGYTAEPSPGSSNNASAFASEMAPAPEPDLPSGLFADGTRTLTVPIPDGTTLRYTTDGSTPTAAHGTTAVPDTTSDGTGQYASFDISATTLLRFRLFADGMMPSRVVTRSYIKESRTFNIPVVSVVTDPRHFYNDTIGVMVKGTNGVGGRGFLGPCNWNRDWDRPVNFAYTLPDGTTPVDREADLCICGGWSRPNDPHSFKLKGYRRGGCRRVCRHGACQGHDTWLFTRPTPDAPNTVTSRSATYAEFTGNDTANGLPVVPATTSPSDDALYDLFGRKVLTPLPGHIYIRQGKKIIF